MLLRVGNQNSENGAPLHLTGTDLKAHAHGIGASRSGKSKLIEYIARQFIKERQGFCLIDPGGFLFQDLVQWLAYVKPSRAELILLDPSYEKRIVGFNPLHIDGPKNEATISAKVDRIVALTTKALGMTDLTNAPRLERVMRCLYYVLIEQDLSLEAVRYFLSPRHLDVRDAIIDRIQSESIKDQWLMFTGKRPETYLNMVESTANRLFKVLTQPSVKRIIGVPENSINIGSLTNNRGSLLVNLQPSFSFSPDAAHIIGTFLVNEIWETVRKRTREEMRKAPPFYLLVDEFQSFATPDFGQILDQGAKYGLHLILFHQNLNQLDSQIKTAMTACHSRFVFGGVTTGDASQMLEGSMPTFEDLRDDISSVPSLPARHYILKRPDRRLANAYTPEVNEYRVPEEKVELYVEAMTARFMSPAEVDELMLKSVPIPEPPPPAEQPASVDLGELLSPASGKPTNLQKPKQEKKQPFVLSYERARGTKQHREAQRVIGQIAETYGFRSQIEKTVLDGTGSVDVSLEKEGLKIACEVSVTTSAAWEAKNALKCLRAGYERVVVIARHPKDIPGLTAKLREVIPVMEQEKMKVFTLADFLGFLREVGSPADPNTGKPGKLAGARLDFKEAVEFFDVSTSTLYRWVQAGRIPFIRIGRIYQFDRDVLVLLGRHDLSGKRKASVNLEPVKIEKAKSPNKKQQDDRYRKMLNLD